MDLTNEALRLSMGMARTRAEVASVNIANVDTPGYRAQQADFGHVIGLLQQAAVRPQMSGDSLKLGSEADVARPSLVAEVDEDAVHLDGEVADLEAASADYQSMTAILSRRFSLMQLALSGRG